MDTTDPEPCSLVITDQTQGTTRTIVVVPPEGTDTGALESQAESERAAAAPAGTEPKDPNWGRVATGTYHAYENRDTEVSDAAGLLKVPGDRYKPTSLGRKKSSFLVTEEDLAERGESVEPYSESVQSYPLS
mmetsp:Transcript_151298/g.264336  ORF Transcript_151298/g.264336 Transcript_151298/m.264336 type:complete len:132 (-) Transcript_151298:817-1212(-)